ncbi:hypothetical protein KM043_017876 [Ampulex compressa]|nr:hypothetical protein KM043_017876 [Ampulex compressa]
MFEEQERAKGAGPRAAGRRLCRDVGGGGEATEDKGGNGGPVAAALRYDSQLSYPPTISFRYLPRPGPLPHRLQGPPLSPYECLQPTVVFCPSLPSHVRPQQPPV